MNELINLGNGAFVKVIMLKGERGTNIGTIAKTGTSGLVDTYTVTLTDGHTTTFTVTNGSSIDRVVKTDTQGTVDTYTIYLTNGNVGGTFTVTNATGVIDENFSSTSTNAIQTATTTNVVSGVENGSTASRTYNAGEYILRANKMYKVTDTVAQGDTWTVGVNLDETNIGLELSGINADLTANSKKYQADYQNDKYGFSIDGKFYELGGGGLYPDFKNKIATLTLGPNNDYTAPKDCYLYGIGRLSSGYRTIKINGEPLSFASSDAGITPISTPIQAGDVISCVVALQSGSDQCTTLCTYEFL